MSMSKSFYEAVDIARKTAPQHGTAKVLAENETEAPRPHPSMTTLPRKPEEAKNPFLPIPDEQPEPEKVDVYAPNKVQYWFT